MDYECLGLRYDDLYDPLYDLDIKETLNRLPREIVDARNQRLKRAMDLSMKHEYLPDNLQVCLQTKRDRALGNSYGGVWKCVVYCCNVLFDYAHVFKHCREELDYL